MQVAGRGEPGTRNLLLLPDALLLIGVRLLVSASVWWSGFRAVSDDDYARVVIAQKFASTPALDPSGTSWLPFPFWLQGSAMGLFGPELRTATCVAWASGAASTLLVWLAARTLGLTRGTAFLAATLASAIAYSAWLGVATVPESLTAGLVAYGTATLAVSGNRERAWGALALCCATLSRYEIWPVATVFVAFCLRDALLHVRRQSTRGQAQRKQALALVACAVLASSGMLLWLAHGLVRHGNATFFVERVADYQKALGGHDFDLVAAFSRHPRFVVEHAPALLGLATLGAALTLFGRGQPERPLSPLVRPLLACAGLVAFLMVGDLRGAGATHHPARTLLPVWFLACMVVTLAWPPILSRYLLQRRREQRTAGLVHAGVAVMVLGIILVDGLHNGVLEGARGFVDRSDELRIGEHARRVAGSGRVLIAPEDYGYLAMIAAVADPARVDVFDDQDPRRVRRGNIFDQLGALERRLARDQISVLVVPRALLQASPQPLERRALESLRLRKLTTASAKYELLMRLPRGQPHG